MKLLTLTKQKKKKKKKEQEKKISHAQHVPSSTDAKSCSFEEDVKQHARRERNAQAEPLFV
jgi:hypothetical protein